MIVCDCSEYVDESADVYRSQIIKARKEHKCGECGDPILPGDKYEKVTACWEGTWGTHKTCRGCYHIRSEYMPSGWYFGQVAQGIYACLGFDYREDPALWEDDPSLETGSSI